MMSNLGFFNMSWLLVLYLSNVFSFFCLTVSLLLVVMLFSNCFWCFNMCWRFMVDDFSDCLGCFFMDRLLMVDDLSNNLRFFNVYRSWFGVVNLWLLLWLLSMFRLRFMVSLRNMLGLVNMMWLFFVNLRSVFFSMDDRRSVMNFGYRLVMLLNMLVRGFFVSNVYGRIVMFEFWLSMVSLLSLFWFFDVNLLFMMNFNIVLLGGLLVMGLGKIDLF